MTPDYIIFTDASVKLIGEDNISAYAAVLLNCTTMKYTTISGMLHHRSICFCEAWAIYQGLRTMNRIRKENKLEKVKLLVVTDSKLNVQILTDWIKNKWDTSDWYNWKKRGDGVVQNQDIYRLIVKVLDNPHLKVRLIHMNSHAGENQAKQKSIFAKLAKENINISENVCRLFVKMNAVADETAHQLVLKEYRHPSDFEKLKYKKGKMLYV